MHTENSLVHIGVFPLENELIEDMNPGICEWLIFVWTQKIRAWPWYFDCVWKSKFKAEIWGEMHKFQFATSSFNLTDIEKKCFPYNTFKNS